MPTTIVPNGEVRLEYTVAGLVHVLRMRCNINNPSAGSGYLLDTVGGGTIGWATATAQVDTIISTYYNASTSFGNWTLLHRVGSNYIPLDGHLSTASGSNTGANEAAGQNTQVARDALNDLVKLVFLESAFQPPTKTSGGTMMADAILTTSGHIGQWFQGRSGNPPVRQISQIVTLNRKIRRRRGLA